MYWITIYDYLLLPFYIAIIYAIAYSIRRRKYPIGHPWRRYFIPGLTVKVGGALFIGLIYQYYYGAGDTQFYFQQAKVVNSAFGESPEKWINLILHIPQGYEGGYIDYTSQMLWYNTLNNYMVVSITAVLNAVTFNTYLPTSILFAAMSFTGMWALFRTFAKIYRQLLSPIALATLFIPSTVIWGSGIFKDTICMFGMGWMIYGVFTLLIQRRLVAFEVAMMLLGIYLIAIIKIYILLAFIPALALWILFTYSARLKNAFFRFVLKTGFGIVVVAGLVLLSSNFATSLGKYSLDNIQSTANITQTYIYESSGEQGSRYSLGELDFSPTGIIKSIPLAINVTLFRPYLWEANKAIILFNAIEAFIFLALTLKLIFTLGPAKIWRAINSDANIQFCLIFTLIFAFAVGLTSGNFGTLSRYRIPCLPLYGLAIILIYYSYNPPEKRFLSIR